MHPTLKKIFHVPMFATRCLVAVFAITMFVAQALWYGYTSPVIFMHAAFWAGVLIALPIHELGAVYRMIMDIRPDKKLWSTAAALNPTEGSQHIEPHDWDLVGVILDKREIIAPSPVIQREFN